MAGDHDQVQPTIIIQINECVAPLDEENGWQSHSSFVGEILKTPFAIVEIEWRVVEREIRDEQRRSTGVKIVSDSNTHGRLFCAVFAERSTRFHADFRKLPVALVAIEKVRRGVIRNINVRTATIIEIGPCDAEAVIAIRVVDSGPLGYVRKGAVSIVVKQCISRSLKAAWATLHINPHVLAIVAAAKNWRMMQIELGVVHHHQVKKSVAIVVGKGRSGGPSPVGNSCLGCHISESAVPVVAI